MRYKIWKASIETYRVLDQKTGLISICDTFYTLNALFKVDMPGFLRAEVDNFKNSGKPNDYFAWIETNNIYVKKEVVHHKNNVYYNPFKHPYFRDRNTKKIIHIVKSIIVTGNTLSYVR